MSKNKETELGKDLINQENKKENMDFDGLRFVCVKCQTLAKQK